MGLPSNQGNIFYWARPLITRERAIESEGECERGRKESGRRRGGGQTERRLGFGWCLRCYVWLIWAHLFFPFSLMPLSFFPSISFSLIIVPSLALPRSLTLPSFLLVFLFPFLYGSPFSGILTSACASMCAPCWLLFCYIYNNNL